MPDYLAYNSYAYILITVALYNIIQCIYLLFKSLYNLNFAQDSKS